MKIQIIRYEKRENFPKCEIATYAEPLSLDMFDINIFDLCDSRIWCSKSSTQTLDCINDFKSVRKMLENSKTATNIIVFPQNVEFNYDYSVYAHCYQKTAPLKDHLLDLQKHIFPCLLPTAGIISLLYENSKTILGGHSVAAAFCFSLPKGIEYGRAKSTHSIGSNKLTTFCLADEEARTIYTTLNVLESEEILESFLAEIGLLGGIVSDYPAWLHEYTFGDDQAQQKNIEECTARISQAEDSIQASQRKLEKNLKYKSILCETGENLVAIVFEILERLLSCNLGDFNDNHREDFLIKKENITFIGEIKGISTNVRSENVSQLDVHYHTYLDTLQDEGRTEKVKALLIITPFRNKDWKKREPVHENQLSLATRNGSLIIETKTLLDLFEKHLRGEISSEHVEKILSEKTGILTLLDFENAESTR